MARHGIDVKGLTCPLDIGEEYEYYLKNLPVIREKQWVHDIISIAILTPITLGFAILMYFDPDIWAFGRKSYTWTFDHMCRYLAKNPNDYKRIYSLGDESRVTKFLAKKFEKAGFVVGHNGEVRYKKKKVE